MADLGIQGINSISDVLDLKSRLGVLSVGTEEGDPIEKSVFKNRYTFLVPEFLSKKKGLDWTEYKILYLYEKTDSLNNLELLFNQGTLEVEKLMEVPNIESVGLQEIDCGKAKYYYVLIYLIVNE